MYPPLEVTLDLSGDAGDLDAEELCDRGLLPPDPGISILEKFYFLT